MLNCVVTPRPRTVLLNFYYRTAFVEIVNRRDLTGPVFGQRSVRGSDADGGVN